MLSKNHPFPLTHHRANCAEPQSLKSYLVTSLNQTEEQADFLLQFGAVYLNDKRASATTLVRPLDLLRVHGSPRRFFVSFNIKNFIIASEPDFLVLLKPFGIPCPPTVDNQLENVLSLAQKQLGQSLYLTHRIDTGTHGLLVLAKNKAFQSWFNKKLVQQEVEKKYRSLTKGEDLLKPGTYVHYMAPSPRAPKEVFSELQQPEYKKCVLEILSARRHHPPDSLNEYEIKLITGRTHQIRSQLAVLQNPILNDTLYRADKSEIPLWFLPPEMRPFLCAEQKFPFEHFALKAYHLSFRFRGQVCSYNI